MDGDVARAVAVKAPKITESELAVLFRAYHGALCTFVYRMVRDRAVAEEVVQEVFLGVWRGGTASVTRAYLYAAARHRTLNYLRHQRYTTRWMTDADADLVDVASDTTAADRVHYRDLHEAVRHAIAALPARAREVITLRRDQGLAVDEIAIAMGISVKTVENHLTRAIRALRVALAAHWG